ncbi:DUF397 domain-containing protein [Streptosporangium amethystogenes subsp. fukuiense]|uniref:DUF397 domain-containing protein n=1 Tax=Streptosporangium amethystogenes subsp. fukuiense TaxID=698418 RepID=A0ABW2TC08_9ACTN
MDQIPLALAWRKSSKSAQQDNCVEVAALPGGGRAIRDSKDPNGPILRFASSDWQSFVRSTKSGGFDNLGC